jgi:hypothetical protein
VTALVSERDGRYLATFARGTVPGHRGAARRGVRSACRRADRSPARARGRRLGVSRPTAASTWPWGRGAAEAERARARRAGRGGAWREVVHDLGFPAGKNKSMLIDLAPARGARGCGCAPTSRSTGIGCRWPTRPTARCGRSGWRRRARAAVPRFLADVVAARRGAGNAGLRAPRQHGAALARPRRLPHALRRGGELLAGVDDRYVIMNAGDELRLQFRRARRPRAAGGATSC